MSKRRIRCAIYTRKSSEEGLEQDFNSLDAQYEACAAYISSQRHEGWKLSAQRYDDGGISGGTLQRPALQRLLSDIDAGLIDRIVVYKIDRLTRSLNDFSKIVDRLDAAEASFVSVTQSFNTATSMGRLTLNMLLSFAQFEREVTAERIRDKIAASKAKGLWMGGTVPLGYRTNPDKTVRGLLVDEEEAQTIKQMFALYREQACLRKVEACLLERGVLSQPRGNGPAKPFSRGAIHKILTNPMYAGRIRHKDKVYDGRHDPIIDLDIWQEVQSKLQAKSQKRRGHQLPSTSVGWLKGKLFDPTGDLMTPTHTSKNGTKIRYYISNRLTKAKDPTGWRLPAKTLEPIVSGIIAKHLSDCAKGARLIDASDIHEVEMISNRMVKTFDCEEAAQPAELKRLADVLQRGDLVEGQLILTLDQSALASALNVDPRQIRSDALRICSSLTLRKRGVETKIIAGDYIKAPDRTLQIALAKAHVWVSKLRQGETISKIAQDESGSDGLIRKRIRLAFLSPKIQKAILTGAQPHDLTLAKILRTKVTADWREQEQLLGF